MRKHSIYSQNRSIYFLISFLLVLTFIVAHVNISIARQTTPANVSSEQSALVLPNFSLPYASDVPVRWTGGPHEYSNTNTLDTFPVGNGSGLDFAMGGQTFDVLNMATGTVEEIGGCNNSLGCKVAVRHFTGSTVMIYSHLKAGTIAVEVGDRLDRSDNNYIAKAGSTGTERTHLHIEFRDGNGVCDFSVSPPELCGDAIGWDDLVLQGEPNAQIDGYYIFGYYGEDAYNYDGSAVKGNNYVAIEQFPYEDNPGSIQRYVTAWVHSDFVCDSQTNCEDNRPLT